MRILGVSGSLKKTSLTTSLLRGLQKLAPQNAEIVVFDHIDKLPHFNPDIDSPDSPPQSVVDFRKALKESSAALFCTPEYAHGVPGVLKNALDWLVGSGELVDKPVAVISASPSWTGPTFAHASLVETITVMNAKISPATCLMISSVTKKIDKNGLITDQDVKNEIEKILRNIVHI